MALHRRLVINLVGTPERMLAVAHDNLRDMRAQPDAKHYRRWSDEWCYLLSQPLPSLVAGILDPSPAGDDRRQMSPFAGVLSVQELQGALQESRP